MAVRYELRFASRLAQHHHILWTESYVSGAEAMIPPFEESRQLRIPLSSFDQGAAPLRYGRYYPAHVLSMPAEPPGGIF